MKRGDNMAKVTGKDFDHPLIFLFTIWIGCIALTSLAVWVLSSSRKFPGLLALIQGGKG